MREQCAPGRDLQFDADFRITTREIPQHARQEILGGRHQRHAQAAAPQTLQIIDRRFKTAPDVVELAYRLQHLLACCGQDHLAARLLEQGQAQGIGDLLDLQRDGGLSQMQENRPLSKSCDGVRPRRMFRVGGK
jgi:hypothetical protein